MKIHKDLEEALVILFIFTITIIIACKVFNL